MAQNAYDFERFETRKKEKDPVRLKSVQGGKKQKNAAVKIVESLSKIVLGVLFVVASVGMLQSHVQITEISQDTSKIEMQLQEAQNMNNYLQAQVSKVTNMENVDEIAAQLGLVKLDESQVTYIRIGNEAVVEGSQTIFETAYKWVQDSALEISAYFNP